MRAKLIPDDQPLNRYGWSSYPGYLKAQRAPWLRVDRVLGEFGIPGDTRAGRRRFEQVMEKRRFEAEGEACQGLERGWCHGTPEFREELLAQVRGRIGPNHFGPERRESAEDRAAGLLRERLAELRMTAARFQSLPSNAAAKVELARRLRQETTMSLKWIARQMGIGSWKYLSNLLGRAAPKPA